MRKQFFSSLTIPCLALACSSNSAAPGNGQSTADDAGNDATAEHAGNDVIPDQNSGHETTPDHTAPDASPDADPNPIDATDAPSVDRDGCLTDQVWKASSARIEIRSFGFFAGASGYEKNRADLAAAQLAALDRLCVTPTPPRLTADNVSYVIKVIDDDGSVLSYRAAQGNVVDSDEGANGDLPTIDFTSWQPMLATFKCLASGQTRIGAPMPPTVDGGRDAGDPGATAPALGSDLGCLNGVFVRSCAKVWLKLSVAASASYKLETVRCIGTTTLRIFNADGQHELAAGAPGSSPDCPTVSHQFQQAGDYLVQVDQTTDACEGGTTGPAGDMFLRVLSAN